MKRAQIRDLLLASPHLTQRQVAAQLHVSPGYVHLVRHDLAAAGLIDRLHGGNGERSAGEVITSLTELIDAGRTFGAIVIDPPWPYSNQGTRGATSRKKKFYYHTMTLDALKALPIDALAAPNSHGYLWTTVAFQEVSYALLRAWGFEPKSQAIWCKPQLGLGNYYRLSHEILLLGVKGTAPFRTKGLRSWFECRRGPHSSKPEQVRHWIQQASPGPFLELFGRRSVPGWVVFGDQMTEDLFTERPDPPRGP